jgi:hypothetical protein
VVLIKVILQDMMILHIIIKEEEGLIGEIILIIINPEEIIMTRDKIINNILAVTKIIEEEVGETLTIIIIRILQTITPIQKVEIEEDKMKTLVQEKEVNTTFLQDKGLEV